MLWPPGFLASGPIDEAAGLTASWPLRCGRFRLSLRRPLVMGIVNVTPDSFSERQSRTDPVEAVEWARRLIAEGADLIDIGGESTRPGAPEVPVSLELSRVMPVLADLRDAGVPLSIDTRKPAVMREAIAAGADMINDVNGFCAPGAIEAVAQAPVGLCVMHMQGEPATMQQAPAYANVLGEVAGFFARRIDALRAAGVTRDRILVDPGIGFGKDLQHNLDLLAHLGTLARLAPVLVGVSRKSVIGKLTGRDLADRLPGSLAAMLAAVERGAAIVRVHDVAQTVDALRVWRAISEQEKTDGA